MDSISEYFSSFILITRNDKDRIKTTDLFDSYSSWQQKNPSSNNYTQRSFNDAVKNFGFPKKESNGSRFFLWKYCFY